MYTVHVDADVLRSGHSITVTRSALGCIVTYTQVKHSNLFILS